MPGGGVTGAGGFCVVVLAAGGRAGRICSPDGYALEVDGVDGGDTAAVVPVVAAAPRDPQAASSRAAQTGPRSRGAAPHRVTG